MSEPIVTKWANLDLDEYFRSIKKQQTAGSAVVAVGPAAIAGLILATLGFSPLIYWSAFILSAVAFAVWQNQRARKNLASVDMAAWLNGRRHIFSESGVRVLTQNGADMFYPWSTIKNFRRGRSQSYMLLVGVGDLAIENSSFESFDDFEIVLGFAKSAGVAQVNL